MPVNLINHALPASVDKHIIATRCVVRNLSVAQGPVSLTMACQHKWGTSTNQHEGTLQVKPVAIRGPWDQCQPTISNLSLAETK
jgi:hypothetical protein